MTSCEEDRSEKRDEPCLHQMFQNDIRVREGYRRPPHLRLRPKGSLNVTAQQVTVCPMENEHLESGEVDRK